MQWSAVSGAARYGVYVSVAPYGSVNQIYQNEYVSGPSFNMPSGYLANGQAYRWKAVAFDGSGNIGVLSSPLYFNVNTGPTPLPDLVPQNITISPDPATAGGSVSVSYSVANTGSVAAPASHTKVQIKDSSNAILTEQTFSTSTIGSHSSVNESRRMSLAGASDGTYYAYVTVDSSSEITQSSRSNDTDYTTFSVDTGGPGTVQVGLLSITADSIVSTGANTLSCIGHVVMNDILHADGTVVVRKDALSVSGSGRLYVTGVPHIEGNGEITLYDGAYMFGATKALSTSINKLLSALNIGGVNVSIESIAINGDAVIIKGDLGLGGPWGTVDVDVASDDNYIAISHTSGVQVVGVTQVQDVAIPGSGFILKNGILTFDTVTCTFAGQFDVGFPTGLVVMGDARLSDGALTSLGMGVDFSSMSPAEQPLILTTPPIYLQEIYGRLDWSSAVKFTTERLDGSSGDLAFTAGPVWTIGDNQYYAVKGTLGGTVDSSGYFEGHGAIHVICDSFNLASAKMIIDKTKGAFIEGNLCFVGILDVDGRLKLDLQNNLHGSLIGRLMAPSDWPFIGGWTFGKAQVYVENRYLIAVTQVVVLGGVGAEFGTDGKWHITRDFSKIKEVTFLRAVGASSVLAQAYDVPAGVDAAILRLVWTSGDTDLTVIDPDGVRYEPSLVVPSATAFYRKNPVIREAYYAIASPKGGAWHMDVSNPSGVGAYTAEVYVRKPSPTLQLSSPASDVVSTGQVTVSWSGTNISESADVSLYYDDDNSGCDGTLIATGIKPAETSSYPWNTAGVPNGTYYVYAKVATDTSIPEFSYSPGTVTVDNTAAPGAPENVIAVAGDRSICVSWDENAESDVLAYKIYYTDDLSSPAYKSRMDAGSSVSSTLDGLRNGVTYRICVTAVDTSLNESPQSQVVYSTPMGGVNNDPVITSRPQRYCRVGTLYSYDATGTDIDGDALTWRLADGPHGSQITMEGHLTWVPSTDQLGNNEFTIESSDGRTGVAEQIFTVTVAGTDEGNLSPSFVLGPPLEVGIGIPFTGHVAAVDPEGDPVSYRMIAGPEAMEFDPSEATIFWIPTANQEGVQYASFEASDGHGGKTVGRFAIRVRPESVTAESMLAVRRLQILMNPRKNASDRFVMKASFNTCGTNADWVSQDTTVTVGPYAGVIPSSGFKTVRGALLRYVAPKGTASGVIRAEVDLRAHTLTVSARNVDMSDLGSNTTVRLQVGEYDGLCYVSMQSRNTYTYGRKGLMLSNVFMVDTAQFTFNRRLPNKDRFVVQGSICSPVGMDLASERVVIEVAGQSWTLAPGSFRRSSKSQTYTYRGTAGATLAGVQVDLFKGTFRIVGKNLDLSDTGNPVRVSISTSAFSGSSMVALRTTRGGLRY